MKQSLIFLLLAFSAPLFASGDTSEYKGFYWGVGYGVTTYEDDTWDESSYIDIQDNTKKFYGGYWFNRIVSVEVGYSDYGIIQSCRNHFCASEQDYFVEPEAYSVAANLGYTFANGFRPFLTLGVSAIELNQSQPVFDSNSELAFRVGLGAEFSPEEVRGLTFRFAWEVDIFDSESYTYYDSDDDWDWWDDGHEHYDLTSSVSSLYLGVSYKF